MTLHVLHNDWDRIGLHGLKLAICYLQQPPAQPCYVAWIRINLIKFSFVRSFVHSYTVDMPLGQKVSTPVQAILHVANLTTTVIGTSTYTCCVASLLQWQIASI
jgi:hypothetical protein